MEGDDYGRHNIVRTISRQKISKEITKKEKST